MKEFQSFIRNAMTDFNNYNSVQKRIKDDIDNYNKRSKIQDKKKIHARVSFSVFLIVGFLLFPLIFPFVFIYMLYKIMDKIFKK